MIDADLEAAFQSTATAKVPGRSYTPRLPIGTHTVIIKQFNVKNTKAKGRMFNAEFVVLESTNERAVNQGHSWPWFPAADKYGIQDGYLRSFLEAFAKCIGDKESTIPQIGAFLAGAAQAGRGAMLKVQVREQTDKHGKLKADPKTGEAYTEALWYPIAQTPENIAEGRKMLDADPTHAIRADEPEGQQVQQVVQIQVAQPAAQAPVAAKPAPNTGMTSLLASLKK